MVCVASSYEVVVCRRCMWLESSQCFPGKYTPRRLPMESCLQYGILCMSAESSPRAKSCIIVYPSLLVPIVAAGKLESGCDHVDACRCQEREGVRVIKLKPICKGHHPTTPSSMLKTSQQRVDWIPGISAKERRIMK